MAEGKIIQFLSQKALDNLVESLRKSFQVELWTNEMLARYVCTELWADLDMTSRDHAVLGEVINRLLKGGEFEIDE